MQQDRGRTDGLTSLCVEKTGDDLNNKPIIWHSTDYPYVGGTGDGVL